LRADAGSCTIVGPGADPSWATDGVIVRGWVAELAPLYDAARAVIAPLRFGAGMKGKVTEALGYGVPVIGSAIAFEGIPANDALVRATTADEYGAAYRELLDDVVWSARSAAGRDVVQRFATPPAIARVVHDLVATLPVPLEVAGETG
jgi:O-antigen biosynthesis protein